MPAKLAGSSVQRIFSGPVWEARIEGIAAYSRKMGIRLTHQPTIAGTKLKRKPQHLGAG
jgi:hypothetical protein